MAPCGWRRLSGSPGFRNSGPGPARHIGVRPSLREPALWRGGSAGRPTVTLAHHATTTAESTRIADPPSSPARRAELWTAPEPAAIRAGKGLVALPLKMARPANFESIAHITARRTATTAMRAAIPRPSRLRTGPESQDVITTGGGQGVVGHQEWPRAFPCDDCRTGRGAGIPTHGVQGFLPRLGIGGNHDGDRAGVADGDPLPTGAAG